MNSDGWTNVTRQNPCPICEKEDWCRFGERVIKCMRVESERPCKSGGWYHSSDTLVKTPHRVAPPRQAKFIDFDAILKNWRGTTQSFQIHAFAKALGVLPEALIMTGAAWSNQYNAWAFPMRDGHCNVIGIRLRNNDGRKWAVEGSRQGIFVPDSCINPNKALADFVFLPEGPTDVAAALSLGFLAVGRPTNLTGNDMVRELMTNKGFYRAVIVADNDPLKQLGNRWGYPGIEGALKLKKELKKNSCIWSPPEPFKDIRQMVQYMGNDATPLIMSDINNKVWSKS